MYQHHFNRLPQSTSNGSNIALMSPSPNSILPMARTSSNSSSQHEMPRSSSNLSGIARLNSNLHGVPRSGSNSSGFETGRTSNTTATTTSGASLYRPSQVHSSHISDHNQLTRLKIATGLSSQLQSLSEVEETDVRPEESLQGPPRYSYLFPEKQVISIHNVASCTILSTVIHAIYNNTLCIVLNDNKYNIFISY